MNEKLAAIEAQLEEIRSEAQREIEEMRQRIRTAEDNALQSAEALLHARESGDPEMYARAAADNRTAKDIAEMYAKKIEQTETKSLISEQEYLDIKQDILREIQAHSSRTKIQAYALIQQMKDLRDDLNAEVQRSNRLLQQVQREIYRAPKVQVTENGHKMAIMDDTYKQVQVLGALNTIVNSHAWTVLSENQKTIRR